MFLYGVEQKEQLSATRDVTDKKPSKKRVMKSDVRLGGKGTA